MNKVKYYINTWPRVTSPLSKYFAAVLQTEKIRPVLSLPSIQPCIQTISRDKCIQI